MHILAWTDCVTPSADKLWYKDTFSSSICKNIYNCLPFTASIR